MKNKKTVVKVLSVIVTVIILGVGAWYIWYVTDMLNDQREKYDQASARVTQLETKLEDAYEENEKSLEKATDKLNTAQKKLEKANGKIKELNERLDEESIEETPVQTSTQEVIPESTPVETIGVTEPGNEFSDGKCYMDIAGSYTEPGSGRVQIMVSPHDAGAADDYVVNINGSNGAMDNSTWSTTANWDAASSSLIYHGNRLDNINGVATIVEGISGSLRFDGPNTLYWTDEGTGNYDRGPFTKY